jgi:hypothetical protein
MYQEVKVEIHETDEISGWLQVSSRIELVWTGNKSLLMWK